MNKQLAEDLKQLNQLLEITQKQSIRYLEEIDHRKTNIENQQIESNGLPIKGIGTKKTLDLFNQQYEPLMVYRIYTSRKYTLK